MLSRNYGRSLEQFIVNLRVAQDFKCGERNPASKGLFRRQYSLTTAASAPNLLSYVNPGLIIGDISLLYSTSRTRLPQLESQAPRLDRQSR